MDKIFEYVNPTNPACRLRLSGDDDAMVLTIMHGERGTSIKVDADIVSDLHAAAQRHKE